ncbi:unnamed protein product [Rotaria sp. Silwood2]|nr:unnamed protein product [Rotaria sp. Silwood2]CAF2959396.1 unnamed protein product [Rotaria sp. Silwood2]CAF4054626.1 unnamed protein product [Rotaria sp. Silwood2]CAF4412361.1 unnamed protein product [Rotaria sp. Silwood2]CAF4472402.1 unnamed protein product [Rotaria sp. Silwood2]
MPNGEDVRLKVDHAKSKKVEGTLYMMSERKGWMPEHRDIFTLSFDYCDIKYKHLHASTTDRSQKTSVLQIPTNLNNLKHEMTNWHINTELAMCLSLNSSLAHKIVKDLTPGGALMHGTTSQTLSRNLN